MRLLRGSRVWIVFEDSNNGSHSLLLAGLARYLNIFEALLEGRKKKD